MHQPGNPASAQQFKETTAGVLSIREPFLSDIGLPGEEVTELDQQKSSKKQVKAKQNNSALGHAKEWLHGGLVIPRGALFD
jgi:hypothetical protein